MEISDVLSSMLERGKLTRADKRWITEKLETQYRHDQQMKLLEIIRADPDMKDWLTIIAGAGTAAIGELLTLLSGSDEDVTDPTWKEDVTNTIERGFFWWALGPVTGEIDYKIKELMEGIQNDLSSDSPARVIGGAMKLAGTGAIGVSVTCRIFRAMNSGSGEGTGIKDFLKLALVA